MSGPILLVGGDSEIGSATATHLVSLGNEVLATTRRRDRVAAGRPFLDLTMPLGDWQPPDNTRAACICAAVARLQDCANDPAGASLINITRTIVLVDKLVARNIPVLFLSTDKVFDGTRARVPAETPTNPVSEYGRQKAATEAALRNRMLAGARITTLRLAKVVSPGMPLIQQWIATLESGTPVRTFYDMMVAPTPMAIVVTAIERLVAEAARGIFQLTGPRDISYTEVARHLAQKLGADADLIIAVSASSVDGMPPGSSPPNTTLDSAALRERFGLAVPDAFDVIDEVAEICRS
jgi:dTDP-4-dehydrorhamnose reductase